MEYIKLDDLWEKMLSIKETDRIKCCPFLECKYRDKGTLKSNKPTINKLLCKNIHKSILKRDSFSEEFIQYYRCSIINKRCGIKLKCYL